MGWRDKHVVGKNQRFFKAFRAQRLDKVKYRYGTALQPVLEYSPAKGLFTLATVQRRWLGAPGALHIDGGASAAFLIITLEGGRTLEFENEKGELERLEQRVGDYYVTNAAAFWHRV